MFVDFSPCRDKLVKYVSTGNLVFLSYQGNGGFVLKAIAVKSGLNIITHDRYVNFTRSLTGFRNTQISFLMYKNM